MLADRVRMSSGGKGKIGPMPFIVGDIIPSTTQLKVSWDEERYSLFAYLEILTDSDNFAFLEDSAANWNGGIIEFYTGQAYKEIINLSGWRNVCGMNGDENCGTTPFVILDTTSLTKAQRTISKVHNKVGELGFIYEEV